MGLTSSTLQVLIPQPAAEELERLLIAQFPLPPLS